MTANKKSDSSVTESTPADKNISIGGDVVDSVVIVGDNNTTFFQKVINIFKSDSESMEHRNRRILLGHVENAWIKGVLDASLHGAALLDLGIKQDPEAATKYPWAIKKESTDETLPAGTSMLEIFDSIGMGRSLLILGAPGSGKTTMLLELARGLIARAREGVTQPIPMVFNLASWTEKLSLADWLAQELNNLYSVPRKTAPDWVKGDKLLLLLDGLDEVRQESRSKCVEAINAFRREHGLTSLAVCSRTQDYEDLSTKLSFEGVIEVQPLTQEQITEFFNHFGNETAGIKQVLQKDNALREMAETPLFLSIMIMAYRDKRDVEILMSGDEETQRKHLFDTYIERMFERPRSQGALFEKQDVLQWLTWFASTLIGLNKPVTQAQDIDAFWIKQKVLSQTYIILMNIATVLFFGFVTYLVCGVRNGFSSNWITVGIYALLAFLLLKVKNKGNRDKGNGDDDFIDFSKETKKGCVTILLASAFGSLLGIFNTFLLLFLPAVSIYYLYSSGLIKSFSWDTVWSLFFYVSLFTSIALSFRCGIGSVIEYYIVRIILTSKNIIPWRLVPFLDHCVDLIFLRRVGGGYIFVHRLLMEHFAEMYVEIQTSEGNQK